MNGKILHEEGAWKLISTELLGITNWSFVRHQGWESVIKHDCKLEGSPYWMLIANHNQLTVCTYCSTEMPASIIALFKLQNMEIIR